MTKRLYVGNLGDETTEQQLNSAAAQHGNVISAQVITDRESGSSRGFGFVEVEDTDAQKVISALNGTELNGRQLSVSEARERTPNQGARGNRRY
jgi:RNA recognition motif-containing protein